MQNVEGVTQFLREVMRKTWLWFEKCLEGWKNGKWLVTSKMVKPFAGDYTLPLLTGSSEVYVRLRLTRQCR